jgi:hypothetical protein
MAKGEISSLPVWAQKYIAALASDAARAQDNLATYKAQHTVGLDESRVIAEPYSECPTPLGDAMIEFRAEGVSFKVHLDADGDLEVRAEGMLARNDGLAVYPQSMNSIAVRGSRP